MKSKLLLILVLTTTINCSRQTGKEDRNGAEAYFNSGKSKAELKNYRGAIEDFSKAIAIDATYAAAYYYRGDARELLPMVEADSAIASNPKSAEAYFKRGNARAYLTVVEYDEVGEYSRYVESLNNSDLNESPSMGIT